MLIRSVTAHAFGPLAGATLEFADGMTVVHGPNESAKSSWHAAIYAALCGRRRGRGRPTPEELEFAARHRPWDRPGWLVAARLVLDDGRRIELRQDLDGLVACDAVDLDLGRDCSAEIMNADTPDAARWLGLDRTSLRATAFVAQAQVLDVLQRADGLQNQLQRAAATAGTDETAAAALRRLDHFQSEHVGSERAPTRPLRRAMDAAGLATTTLTQARADHAGYERKLLALAGLWAESDAAEQAVRHQAAAVARREARQARGLADAAAAVATRLAARSPSPAPTEALVSTVAAALSGYNPSAAAKTAMPVPATARTGGGGAPGAAVTVVDTVAASLSGDVARSVQVPDTAAHGTSEAELYELARLLEQAPAVPEPAVSSLLEPAAGPGSVLAQRPGSASIPVPGSVPTPVPGSVPISVPTATAARARRNRLRVAAIMPAVAIVGALSWAFAGDSALVRAAGVLLILVGVGSAVAALVAAGRVVRPEGRDVAPGAGSAGRGRVAADAREAAVREAAVREAMVREAAVREAAVREAMAREAAAQHAAAMAGEAAVRRAAVLARVTAAGLPADPGLLRQLARHQVEEQAVRRRDEQWQQQAERASEQRLLAAAAEVGHPTSMPAEAARVLRRWQQDQSTAAAERDRATRDAAELAGLLRDRSLAEVQGRAAAAEERVRQLAILATRAKSTMDDRVEVDHGKLAPDHHLAGGNGHADDHDGHSDGGGDTHSDGGPNTHGSHDTTDDRGGLKTHGGHDATGGYGRHDTYAHDHDGGHGGHDRDTGDGGRDRDGGGGGHDHEGGHDLDGGDGGDQDGDDAADLLDRLRDEARQAGHAADSAEASLRQWLAGVIPVGEAEEQLARAEEALAAVRELDATLSLTREFLGQAEQTAHRTIAPRLAAAVSAWLPQTTAGRYTEVMVDPEQLRVQVRGPAGRWRDAGQLSYGTAEQIYLMLRIALAEHLTRAGTVCPLLLDDVTVHADAARTVRLLELLRRAADDRQIILFTQEDRVVDWARRRLTGPQHALVELPEVVTV